MRADGEVCAVLSPVQLSIYYYSSSPDPISKADICPGHDTRAPGGWMGDEMSYWTGGCFYCVIWSLPCEERGYGKIPKGDSEKGSKRKISVQENHRLNGNGVGLEVHRFRLPPSARPS